MAVCKKCLKGNLTWQKVKGKWRLFEKSGVHKCITTISSRTKIKHGVDWTDSVGSDKDSINKLHEEHLSIMNQCDENRYRTMILGDFWNDKD